MFPHTLRLEIIVLLAAKAVLLLALYLLFFSPAHQLRPDAARVGDHIYGAADTGTP